MAGERQQVRLAVAAYFGGTAVADGEVKYQGGPLAAYGLGTAYPYTVKHAPDTDYTAGAADGRNWGAVMSTTAMKRASVRDSYGGHLSGWRARTYTVTCELAVIAELDHIETAGAGLDDLIDRMHSMVAADRTLGTTSGGQILIIQAGEGKSGIEDTTDRFLALDPDKGRYAGQATVTFDVLTMAEG